MRSGKLGLLPNKAGGTNGIGGGIDGKPIPDIGLVGIPALYSNGFRVGIIGNLVELASAVGVSMEPESSGFLA